VGGSASARNWMLHPRICRLESEVYYSCSKIVSKETYETVGQPNYTSLVFTSRRVPFIYLRFDCCWFPSTQLLHKEGKDASLTKCQNGSRLDAELQCYHRPPSKSNLSSHSVEELSALIYIVTETVTNYIAIGRIIDEVLMPWRFASFFAVERTEH